MAPTSRRRTRDELESDDAEDFSDASETTTASDSKRARLGSHRNGTATNGTNGVNGTLTNGNSPDDFQPGAIVRVSVENFVTYEKADFFPGPHLNMVIGPNGTGKSSLVCAICLGLGYSPKHLGRAGSVKEFVKHGKDTATIETELQKRPNDRMNPVIRVQIRREQNTQKWWLNGKETSHKAVQALVRSMKIQVDNLCQFLPQDRVVEFAQSNSVDLLRETLRAAAHEEMLDWQKELQGLHKDKKELQEAVQTDSETLTNLERRQQGLQADVDRIREREAIQKHVRDLQSALLVSRYQEARKKYQDAKERKKNAERNLRQLERDSGPALEAVNEKENYVERLKQALPGKRNALREAEQAAQTLARAVTDAADEVKGFEDKIEAERKGFDKKKKDLATSRTRITSLQADLRNRPPEFNGQEWNQKIRSQEHNRRELEADRRNNESQMTALRSAGNVKNGEIANVKNNIDSFETQQGQQLNFMKKNFPDLARGWEWIQENQNQFEKEVFGPPMISCSIKDERYSDQVQSIFQSDDFTCFTAQTKADYKKLTNQLYKVMSLSVVIRTCSNALDSFKPPVAQQEALQLGLDGFAIDFLDGPAPVLAMLCSERGLHRSGVALKEHGDAEYDRLVNSGKIGQWAAGRQSYLIRRRREYGPQAMTTVTKPIYPGRFWTSQPVDSQEKIELNRRLTELQGERDEMKGEYRIMQQKKADIEAKMGEIEDTIGKLREEKNALQKDFQKWQSLPEKIESEERAKADHERGMRDVRKSISDLQFAWDKSAIARAKKALRHAESLDKIAQAHQALVAFQIQQIEGESDVEGLRGRNAHIVRRLDEERTIVSDAQEDAAKAREDGHRLGTGVQEMLAEADDAYRALLTELSEDKTPADLERDVSAEEAKLELIHTANPNVIRDYERRAGEIARLARKKEGSSTKLQALTKSVEDVMAKFEPCLDELVSRINDAFAYNFEQINCAGEVRVHKDEDFDHWALDIMVRFRENEALQQLNAHRQSGGERAVSTIFYLMALQSMAQAPFRVVDEINQGMDPRNERMVHERMVEIACREHTSQYFLITPKLLTGLRYDPKMRILCIASGEHMPREGKKLDFRRCLKVQKELLGKA